VERELRLPSLNKVIITGYLTQDPEVRYIQSGAAVANVRIGSTRRFRDQAGEWRDDTCFVNVVAWRELAERCGDALKKGSAVLVEGRLQSRSWETEDGQKRSVIEINADRIQFLDKRGGGGDGAPAFAGGGESGSRGGDMPADDLPF
jgi:single-strand DNA-binding protein